MISDEKILEKMLVSFRSNDHSRVEELFLETNSAENQNPQLPLIAGLSLYATGRFTEAEETFRSIIIRFPKYADAYNNLGLTYKRLGKLNAAKDCYSKAIKLKPKSPLALTNLGNIYVLEHLPHKALNQYKTALRISPNYHIAEANYGNCYRLVGEVAKAIKILEKCIENHPGYTTAHTYLSMAYMANGETELAQESVSNALRIDPENVRSLIVRAEIFLYLEDYREALKYFTAATTKESWQDEAWVGLGKVYASLGKNQESIRCYEKALSCELVGVQAKANLANVLITAGHYQRAKKLIIETLKEIPNDKFLNYNLGVQYFTEHNYSKAIKYLSKSDYEHASKYLLEAYYKNSDREKFSLELKNSLSGDSCNAQIGSLCSRAKFRWNIEEINPYCSAPLNYVLKENIISSDNHIDSINMCTESLFNAEFGEAKKQGRLTNGIQTAGNIFASEHLGIVKLRKAIENQIAKYREVYSQSEEPFLHAWPENYVIYGWIISMESGGSLNRHMHETSWLTGTLYLNVPDDIQGNEGSLVVSMTDEADDSEDTMKIIKPITGDLVLFPASLQHNTIPFNSNENRIVLAFDILPRTANT